MKTQCNAKDPLSEARIKVADIAIPPDAHWEAAGKQETPMVTMKNSSKAQCNVEQLQPVGRQRKAFLRSISSQCSKLSISQIKSMILISLSSAND